MDFLLLFIKIQSHLTLCILVKSTVIQCFALFAYGEWIQALVCPPPPKIKSNICVWKPPWRKFKCLKLNTHQQISKFVAGKVCFILISLGNFSFSTRRRKFIVKFLILHSSLFMLSSETEKKKLMLEIIISLNEHELNIRRKNSFALNR